MEQFVDYQGVIPTAERLSFLEKAQRRSERLRCLELAARAHVSSPEGAVEDARKFLAFINEAGAN